MWLQSYYTDPEKQRKGDPGHPEKCPIFLLHKVYSDDPENEIVPDCKSGKLGCVDCKMKLCARLNENLRPIRDRRAELLKHPGDVWDVLAAGRDRARQRAGNVMSKVRSAMKINYRGKK